MKPIELLFGLSALLSFSLHDWWTGARTAAPPEAAAPAVHRPVDRTSAAMAIPLQLPDLGEPLESAMQRLQRLIAPPPGPSTAPAPVRRRGNRKPRLIIDPGHGGHDKGASGKVTCDKAIALAVTLELKKLLDADKRIETYYTRLSDQFVTLGQRADLTRQIEADGFVSLHANAVPRKKTWVNGVEVFHHGGGESALLAGLLERGIVRSTRQNTRGVRSRGYHVLRNASCPAALVELGFVSNRTEEKLMMTAAWRKKVAKALHKGLVDWLIATGRLPPAGGKPAATPTIAAVTPSAPAPQG